MPVNLLLILVGYLVCWQGYKLRRRINGLGHVALILSLTAKLANSTTARISAAHPHSLLAGQFISLIEHIFVVVSVAGLYVFRLAVEGHTLTSRRVQRTIAGGVAMSAAFLVLTLTAIYRGKLISVSVESYRDPVGFAYAFGAGLYYGLMLFAVGRWMVTFTRDKERHFRRGMLLAAVGVFALSALSLGRAIPVAVVFLGGPKVIAPPFLLGTVSAAAFPLIFVGLSYPILMSRRAAYRAWRRQREDDARTSIIWQLCTTAYPEIVLRPRSMVERLRQLIWKPDRLRRRRTETFDALAKLLLGTSTTERTESERAAADILREAVRRYDGSHEVPVVKVVKPAAAIDIDQVGIPGQPVSGADTEMLRELADVLHDLVGADRRRVMS
jgi:hypothetical protein